MKANTLKTQTLVCSVNNNSLAIQEFTIQLDNNYRHASHLALVTASGDTSYDISLGDDQGTYITKVASAILEAPTTAQPVMERFYPLGAENRKQNFTVAITRRVAVAATGTVHVIFRLEKDLPK